MTDTFTPPVQRRFAWRRAAAGTVLIAVALVLGPGRTWYALRRGPERAFAAGQAAFAAGDLPALVAAAEALRQVAGHEPQWHLLEGMVLLRRGELVPAIEEFGHAKDDPSLGALAYALSGEALYKARQFRDAQRILSIAIQKDPRQTDARRWLAALYYDIGAMTLALDELEAVARQAPADPRPNRLRGLIYKDFGLFGEAVAEYRQALARGPRPADAEEIRGELAECLLKLHRPAEALAVLAGAPRSARRLALEAQCRDLRNEKEAARQLVAEALRLDPRHVEALLMEGSLALDAGDPAAAARALEAAMQREPHELRIRQKLAQAYQRLGRTAEAREQAEETRRLRDLVARFTNLHQEAIRRPDDVEIRYQLGLMAGELGKPELARSWFTAVLALDPQHAAAQQALAP